VLIQVAVPVPTLGLLTYRVPEGAAVPSVGARVVVPLGQRIVTGIVVSCGDAADAGGAEIRDVRQVLDAESFVPPDIVSLAQWTAEYYAAGPGESITAVLPPKARGERADAHKTRRVASITAAGLAAPDGLTAKQREALELLAASPSGVPTPALAARGISADTVSRLVGHGLVAVRRDRVDRDPWVASGSKHHPMSIRSGSEQVPIIAPSGADQYPKAAEFGPNPGRLRVGTVSDHHPTPRPLTLEQQAAFARLHALAATRRFAVALLHGVTGSGKTEIYLRLAADVLASGRRALILVPEIALTPAIAASVRDAFGDRVAIQHSALSDGERHDQWQRIRRAEVDVVVGTRSAVFAPLPHVGLIVVDEEHDPSYKQEESPRYHGRDVAIVRAQRADALIVLGSATPSMESYYNAMSGRYERVVLEKRVFDRPLASVAVVDMREEYADSGPDIVLSRALTVALASRLERNEQALVLLNRRGFATTVFCRQCAGTLECPNCSVSLVVHGEGRSRRARCHYCNYSARVPAACPLCAGPYLEQSGFGTERVEAEVKRAFPSVRVARLDRDSIRRKGALSALLARFQRGDIDVLVGTQMIAKGHDFPRVTLVGVVSADVGLGLADFRASERTFQLLTQVAGRAGRGDQPGEAVIQTLYPQHYSIQLACSQDYRAFYERELQFRRAMRYPPHLSLVNTIVRANTFSRAMDDAADVVARLRSAADRHGFRVLGPAPAPLGRLRGEYRAQLLVKGTHRRQMREALIAAIAARPDLARRSVVDIDPVSVL
jgi:primosomal protein N' (replication factor Y) (superfamily II helicase)